MTVFLRCPGCTKFKHKTRHRVFIALSRVAVSQRRSTLRKHQVLIHPFWLRCKNKRTRPGIRPLECIYLEAYLSGLYTVFKPFFAAVVLARVMCKFLIIEHAPVMKWFFSGWTMTDQRPKLKNASCWQAHDIKYVPVLSSDSTGVFEVLESCEVVQSQRQCNLHWCHQAGSPGSCSCNLPNIARTNSIPNEQTNIQWTQDTAKR